MFEDILCKNLRKEALTSGPRQSARRLRQIAVIRQNLLWLQRGLDRAFRTKGNDKMSNEDDIFMETNDIINLYMLI